MSLELTIERNATFVELKWSGTVPDILPMPSPYDALPDGTRVLVDASSLSGASHPVWRWTGVATRAAARGLKIGIISPPGLIFGLFRLSLHTAGVDQENAIAVFHSRREALTWLLGDTPASLLRADETGVSP